VRRKLATLLTGVGWTYPRPVTTLAVLAVGLLSSLTVWALLPQAWRPSGLGWVLLAGCCAYVVLRIGAFTGWSKRFKHTVLDWFGGDVDDAQTWLLAGLAGAGVLVLVGLVQRALS
jgi:hypothetical protein